MPYKIVIKETGTVRKVVKGGWVQVGEKEERGEYTNTVKWVPAYDYAPEAERDVAYEREVLTQEVVDLDVAAVIKAINKL